MTLFDTFIFVERSARNRLSASRPRANAIWAGFQEADTEAPREVYFRGRRECAEPGSLADLLVRLRGTLRGARRAECCSPAASGSWR